MDKSNNSPHSSITLPAHYLHDISAGDVVTGVVIAIDGETILLDISAKQEAYLQSAELVEQVKIGDAFEVVVVNTDGELGIIEVSREKAVQKKALLYLHQCKDNDEYVEGTVLSHNHHGFDVALKCGVNAFLPISLAHKIKIKNPDRYLAQTFLFKLISIEEHRNDDARIIISRRAVLEDYQNRGFEKIKNTYQVNDIVEGKVTEMLFSGALIDVEGCICFLAVDELSWIGIEKPNDILKMESMVRCKIIGIDTKRQSIELSLKQMTPDPWTDIDSKFYCGAVVDVRIESIKKYGLLVSLEEKYFGIIHISELSWEPHDNLLKNYRIHQTVKAQILTFDPEERKLSLSVRETHQKPWEKMFQEYRNKPAHGVIESINDAGLIIKLQNNVRGFLRFSDWSWGNLRYEKSDFNIGEKVTALVLSVAKSYRMLRLSAKALQDNPWPELTKKLKAQTVVQVTVIRCTDSGLVVAFSDELVGFIHKSQLTEGENNRSVADKYKVGTTIKAIIKQIERNKRKIYLSEKLIERQEMKKNIEQYLVEENEQLYTTTISDKIAK